MPSLFLPFFSSCPLLYSRVSSRHRIIQRIVIYRNKNGIARCFGRDVLDKPEVIAEAGSTRVPKKKERIEAHKKKNNMKKGKTKL